MNFQNAQKITAESYRVHWNLMNDDEFGSFKFLKLKYRSGDQIIQLFWRIGSPKEIRFPLFNLRKFQNLEKRTAESSRMYWNLMNDNEFRSFKFLKLKYKRGDQIIKLFCRFVPPKKLGSPSLIWWIFEKLRKVLLTHIECIEI